MVNFFKKFDKNKDNRKKFSELIYSVFKVQEIFTDIQNVNLPETRPCIYAMWHAHQCCVHGFPDRPNCNVLVSRSRDGQIIGDVVEKWGFKVIHGSKGKKGSVEATLQMINALKSGECCAIMVDGPKGPAKVVKDGVVKIAKKAGVPIVPVYWYSPNPTFLQFPSWDKFRIPCFWTKLINIYGEPIYVNPDNDKDEDEEVRLKVQRSLESLEKAAPQAHKEVFRFGLWKK
ncbi:MAG: lysophospholipid acyltransferase family protein [Candidatus Gastranaerophilales bacterium]|nr:lysophospholipid acyltransferase family protein [Candidatus Gastranaerophilales bacterium]